MSGPTCIGVSSLPFRRSLAALVLAGAAVAFYLGMETLTHLDGDRSRPETLFAQGARLAAIFDRVPRMKRRARGVR